MSAGSRVPVVVIGAGPVGVTAALLLARHGVRSVVLERHRDVHPLPRAVAMDDEVRRILQDAGVHEEFAALARPAKGLRLLDARHRVIGEFRRSEHGHHGFPQTSMFDQPELERLLRAAPARRPESELRSGVEVVGIDPSGDGPVRVSFRRDGSEVPDYLEADFVLGCDGAGSLTREAMGAIWEDLRFEERWSVIDVRTHLPVRCWEGVEQVCDPARAATFMRIGEDRYRWEFRLRDGEELDDRRVRELIAPWVEVSHDGDVEVIRQAEYTSGPVSPTAGAKGVSSCWATPPTSLRRSSVRDCAPECATRTTSRGKSAASSNRAPKRACWTPTRANASRTPAM